MKPSIADFAVLCIASAVSLPVSGCQCKQVPPLLPKTAAAAEPAAAATPSLWHLYEQSLKGAKYIDLIHTIAPGISVLKG
jgi:hypothetical protein